MKKQENTTYDRLIEKSLEAFLLAIELYNRPTIRYHVEGCAFFLCNAWELMLKARIINKRGESAIYYSDSPERTISLHNCVQMIFPNENDPLRKNLEKINDLRNTSTHFVTDEYELFYGPLFQACVKNFDDKMCEFHGREISDIVPESYLVLSVKRDIIDPERIRAKYSPEVVKKILEMNNSVALGVDEQGSPRYSGFFETNFVLVRNPEKADLAVRYTKDAEPSVTVVKQIQNVHDKYPYTTKTAIEQVKRRLEKAGIQVGYKGECKKFNSFHWNTIAKYYNLKGDERYAHNRSLESEKSANYVYSQQAIDVAFEAIKGNPKNAIEAMIARMKK